MTTTESTTPKKVTRRKKTITVPNTSSENITPSVSKLTPTLRSFSELLTLIVNAKGEFEQL